MFLFVYIDQVRKVAWPMQGDVVPPHVKRAGTMPPPILTLKAVRGQDTKEIGAKRNIFLESLVRGESSMESMITEEKEQSGWKTVLQASAERPSREERVDLAKSEATERDKVSMGRGPIGTEGEVKAS